MALFHFHVGQVKRSKGQSAVAAAAYRAGEKLYSRYYNEFSDFTRKSAVMKKQLPRMTYQQHRTACRLVHACCNYDAGNCIALDDGESCPCVQSISRSLLCKWFRAAVLPLDAALSAELFPRRGARTKRCGECGASFVPGSNRAKYCPECAAKVRQRQTRERVRRHRADVTL